MTEVDPLIVFAVGLITTVAAIVGANIWNSKSRKDRQLSDKHAIESDIAKAQKEKEKDEQITAREKIKEEQLIAKELAMQSEHLAEKVKQSMEDYIQALMETERQNIRLERSEGANKLSKIEAMIRQTNIDLKTHINSQKEIDTRFQKDIEMIQTMAYGADAKSNPAFMAGENETFAHKAEPGKGMFYQQSEEEQEQQTQDNEERLKNESEKG